MYLIGQVQFLLAVFVYQYIRVLYLFDPNVGLSVNPCGKIERQKARFSERSRLHRLYQSAEPPTVRRTFPLDTLGATVWCVNIKFKFAQHKYRDIHFQQNNEEICPFLFRPPLLILNIYLTRSLFSLNEFRSNNELVLICSTTC